MGIGDEVMVTGMAREAQERDRRRVRIEYEKGKQRWCELWEANPRIAHPGEPGDFQILNPRADYLRPYCSAKAPDRWTWKPYRPPRGEIYLKAHERAYANMNRGLFVLGPWLKRGAPGNKAWPGWPSLALLLRGRPLVVLGPEHERRPLAGVEHYVTTLRQAAAIVSSAAVVITQEGALHHIAAVFGTPAVVIFGGYIAPEVTGYDGQRAFFRGGGDGLGCGMRVTCRHCEEAMASISAEEVATAALEVAR